MSGVGCRPIQSRIGGLTLAKLTWGDWAVRRRFRPALGTPPREPGEALIGTCMGGIGGDSLVDCSPSTPASHQPVMAITYAAGVLLVLHDGNPQAEGVAHRLGWPRRRGPLQGL
jgi:hypothetical protein